MIVSKRKSIFVQLVFLSLLYSLVSIKPASAQQFSLGVKAGPLALRSVYGDKEYGKTIDDQWKFGYYTAGIIGFPLKKNYSCIIEGGFSQKGRNSLFNNGTSRNYATYHFIDATLLLRRSFKFYLGKDVPADWFINIGPHISYWLGGKGTIGSSSNAGKSYKIVFTDSAKLGNYHTMYMVGANRWLFGADIGVGMEAPITKTQRIMFELRFTWGHTYYGGKTTANYDWVSFTDQNMQANEKVVSFTLAYMFDVDLKLNKTGRSTKDKETHRKPVKKRRR